MEFLKSAVASAIAKGPPFPYSFGDKVDIESSIWTLHNGTRREDGTSCSIFSFDAVTNRSRLPLAKNAAKKLRTLRHPGVIKVLDTVETDTYIYIATERIVPLRWHLRRKSLSAETIKWGLHNIASVIKFIDDDAQSIHGNIKAGSVYTTDSGEWKLGGFEVLSSVKDDDAVIYTFGSLVPDSARYAPPELVLSGWGAIKNSPFSAVDSYGFGALVYEAFNGEFLGRQQAGETKNIPSNMQAGYRRLMIAHPKARMTVAHFLDQGRREGSFFDGSLIKITAGIENLGVKTAEEREEFFRQLGTLAEDFPEELFKMKVLPELLKSVEFGGGGPKALGLIIKIGAKLSSDEFESRVTPVMVRLFANPDRAIRVALLDSLPHMIDRLTQKVVNDKIFPQLVTGFTDSAPVVREQTLKSVLVIIGKLSERTINGELLRYLARMANDEQPGIRTNTTICLGKIAKNIGTSSRAKVLMAAFLRSLKDPFAHARNAALMALAATIENFPEEDCASRILPGLCPLLLDKEKFVRVQSSKTIEGFLQRVRKSASELPDNTIPQASEVAVVPRTGTPLSSELASSWTGWAISSFTNKIPATAGDMTMANGENGRVVEVKSVQIALSTHRQTVTSATLSATPSLSRTSTSTVPATVTVEDYIGADDRVHDDGGWGELGDNMFADELGQENHDDTRNGYGKGGGNDNNDGNGIDRAQRRSYSATALPMRKKPAVAMASFDDGSKPDFAGWLAAQTQKKGDKGLGKVLSAPTMGAQKVPLPRPKAPMKEKEPTKDPGKGDDEGWGDAW